MLKKDSYKIILTTMKRKLAINASRALSGGAKEHLVEILNNLDSDKIWEIHVWLPGIKFNNLPKNKYIIYHESPNGNIILKLLWEYFVLPRYLKRVGIDVLFNVDAGSVCRFSPYVTFSQDLLSFERGELLRGGFSVQTFRLIVLRYVQISSFKHSIGTIFLTDYAKKMLSKYCSNLTRQIVIPHGRRKDFLKIDYESRDYACNNKLQLLYVSPIWLFKHQWHLVHAVSKVRELGYNVTIDFVGGFGDKRAVKKLKSAVRTYDRFGEFVTVHGHIDRLNIDRFYLQTDAFIFASSCENLPITILEAMSYGLPILSSNRGPMPSILKSHAIYFDPENVDDIVKSLLLFLGDKPRLGSGSVNYDEIMSRNDWKDISRNTIDFLLDCCL